MKCRLCKTNINTIAFSIKNLPNVGDFLTSNEIGKEQLNDLTIYYCDACKALQSKNVDKRKSLYTKYFYKTHNIKTLVNHFYNKAISFSNEVKNKNVEILEIGGNSCPFGEKLAELGYNKFINFDPSTVALQYKPPKCVLINDYFNYKNAKKYFKDKKFDYIFSSNNFAHIENIHDFIKGITFISKPTTELTIEVQSLNYLIDELCYPFFYPEHIHYYSEFSLVKLLAKHKFYIKSLNLINVHGKSLQVTFSKNKDCYNLKLEKQIVLQRNSIKNDVILDFNKKIKENKFQVTEFINFNKNKKIAFYGASGQANVFLTYNFSETNISKYPIIDDAELKRGLYTPKTHLKIYPSSYLNEYKPDYIIVLSYNFYNEILEKNSHLNTKWIIPLPNFKIL